jgi:hypothetical protein
MPADLRVAELWRYPVKSLAGEQLTEARLTPDGVSGDRLVHVTGSKGLLTGRIRSGLLTLPATTAADGGVLVAGRPWSSAAVAELIRHRAGPDARLIEYGGPERFDVGNLLVATDSGIASFGHDRRRLRPNLVIAGVPADAERYWPGHALMIGDAVIGLYSLRARCIVTSIDPDTGAQDLDVYRHIRRDLGGKLALDSWVISPGTVRVGDAVRLVPTDEEPAHLGGWTVGVPYNAVSAAG